MLPFLLPRYINDRSILLPPILEPWIGFSSFFICSIRRIIVVCSILSESLLLVAVAANESTTIFVGNQ